MGGEHSKRSGDWRRPKGASVAGRAWRGDRNSLGAIVRLHKINHRKKEIIMKRIVCLAIVAMNLSGCSGAPSDGNIREALLAEQKRAAAQTEAIAAGSGFAGDMVRNIAGQSKFEIVSAHKLGCKEDGENAYRCDVEIEAKQGEKTIKGPPTSLRFVKGSDGWRAQQ